MEKILSDSEKIRRAEAIYLRRKGLENQEETEKQSNFKIYKFLFKVLLLINIVVLVLSIQNKEYIFNKEFLSEYSKYSNDINQNINNFILKLKQKDEENVKEYEQEKQEVPIVQETSGVSSINELNQDANKEIQISFIKPVEGTVSSNFGDRQSNYQKISGFHKGIDIAANAGTKIIASMSGAVTQVSGEGDYGNHVKISNEDFETLYAHCQKIYVAEGDYINQGQEIAEVGSTRK